MKAVAAVLDKKGGEAAQKVALMLDVLGRRRGDAYCIATPKEAAINASLEKLPRRWFKSQTALGQVFLKILVEDKPKITQFGKSILLFDGRVYNPPIDSLEAFFVQKHQTSDVFDAAKSLVKEFDGCFAFAIAEDGRLIAGRDALGLYPLYYGENGDIFAVASECKALWKLGISEAKSLPPGHLLLADGRSLKTIRVKTPESIIHERTLEEAVLSLQKLLWMSTVERTINLGKVAVAFSGGLDSSLTAFLAKKAGVEVHLIHVSLEDQRETQQAEEAARLLDLPIHRFLHQTEDVEQVLPKVLWCIESPNPIKTSIGIPVFWAAEKAAELGFKILFAGQGADELFGGYRRHLTLYARFGREIAEKAITSDIMRMHEENFERDFKVCSFNNVELRLPFASYPLVEFAMSLPLNLKISSKDDTLRKFVLRKTAEKLGLPSQIVYKPKKAMQYATGVDKALKKLAKKRGMPLKQHLHRVFQSLW